MSLRLIIDPGITKLYRSLIPFWKKPQPQAYEPHISVVRKEVPTNLAAWGRYEGEEVEFFYDPTIQFSETYCWLNCFSVRLEAVRLELGLPVSSMFGLPPDGFVKTFHTTLGNYK